MRALSLYAGPKALSLLRAHGPRADHVRAIPAAAGGPKGLILGALDRFVFGHWLTGTSHTIDLVGASIGAWRMATACLADPVPALARLEHDYIHQDYEAEPGRKRPSPARVSEAFGQSLAGFYQGRVAELLSHPRWHLHIVTSRGRGLLAREHPVATPLGYAVAFAANALHRRGLSLCLQRVMFSVPQSLAPGASGMRLDDFPSTRVALTEANFADALRASCSIPFLLQSVPDIAGAPRGSYWDGGITDYHLHLDYRGYGDALVLYPHFQRAVVPGWLDKGLRWRHRATPFLDSMLLLAPRPEWVATLPNAKLPDRNDFIAYAHDVPARIRLWREAASAAGQLADEFAQWLERPDLSQVQAL